MNPTEAIKSLSELSKHVTLSDELFQALLAAIWEQHGYTVASATA
jgi:hypothetical protein